MNPVDSASTPRGTTARRKRSHLIISASQCTAETEFTFLLIFFVVSCFCENLDVEEKRQCFWFFKEMYPM